MQFVFLPKKNILDSSPKCGCFKRSHNDFFFFNKCCNHSNLDSPNSISQNSSTIES